jgi:hypothetical protein
MDRTYLDTNRIVERYMSGELTVREARQFEKFCLEHPDVLHELPIPVRIKARLARHPVEDSETGMYPAIPSSVTRAATSGRHHDAAHDDDDADEDDHAASGGKRSLVTWLVVGAIAVSGWIAFAVGSHSAGTQLRTVQAQAKSAEVQAPASVQTYRVVPSKVEPTGATLALGWPNPPQLLDLKIDMSDTQFNTFQVTIDKVGAARIIQMRRIARDSNKELRLALNSSAFGPGDYMIRIEGYTWRGETVNVAWVDLSLQ